MFNRLVFLSVNSTSLGVTLAAALCSLLLSHLSYAGNAISIPQFELAQDEAMFTLYRRQITLRQREGVHARYHEIKDEGFVRMQVRKPIQDGESQRWFVQYLEHYKGVGQKLNMAYENSRLMGSSSTVVLDNGDWRLENEDPGQEIDDGFNEQERKHLIRVVSTQSFYALLSGLISSKPYELNISSDLPAELASVLGGDGSISLTSLTDRWGSKVASFTVSLSSFFDNDLLAPCHYQIDAFVDDGRIINIGFACNTMLTKQPNVVSGYFSEQIGYAYSNRAISQFSPEPVMSVHPNGDITDMKYMPTFGLLAYVSKGINPNDSGSNWLSFWDINQQKNLFSTSVPGQNLTLSDKGDTLASVSDSRLVSTYVPIGGRFVPFGHFSEFDLKRKLVSQSAFGRYLLAVNEMGELELLNPGYNSSLVLMDKLEKGTMVSAAEDGRVLLVTPTGQAKLYTLTVSHEFCGDGDFTTSWCDEPDVHFTANESIETQGDCATLPSFSPSDESTDSALEDNQAKNSAS